MLSSEKIYTDFVNFYVSDDTAKFPREQWFTMKVTLEVGRNETWYGNENHTDMRLTMQVNDYKPISHRYTLRWKANANVTHAVRRRCRLLTSG